MTTTAPDQRGEHCETWGESNMRFQLVLCFSSPNPAGLNSDTHHSRPHRLLFWRYYLLGFNLNFCRHSVCVARFFWWMSHSWPVYILLTSLFILPVFLSDCWLISTQHTGLSWVLDVLLIKCISLRYFLAVPCWYSSVYGICCASSSSVLAACLSFS